MNMMKCHPACAGASSRPRSQALGQGRWARQRLVVRAASAGKSMTVAEERWESQVREGRVKNITCKDAGIMMKEDWTLLDVRPPHEVRRVTIQGAVHVPLFVEDEAMDLGTLLKKSAAWGMGGWWLGGTHMIPNEKFMAEVQQAVPKDAKVIVGCQKGLRSLAACEKLSKAGYETLAWINGGFDTSSKGDLPSADGKDVRYAGIGGLSEVLGWTEVQQEESRGFFGGFQNILKLVGVVLLLDGLLFAYEQLNYMKGNGML